MDLLMLKLRDMSQGNERVLWVDCAKGIGILLIVLWHSPTNIINESFMLWAKVSAVPLFFFISGFFVSNKNNFKVFAKKKARTILLPYISGSFVAILGVFVLSGHFFGWQDVGAIAYGSFHYLEWGPLWFLPNLFLVSVLGYFLISRFGRSPKLMILSLTLLMILNVSLLDTFWVIPFSVLGTGLPDLTGWPFSADILFISLFFYVLGYLLYDFLVRESGYIFWVFVSLFFVVSAYFNSNIMDLAMRRYDHFFWTTVYALSGIIFLIGVSKLVSSMNFTLKPLSYIGENTLIILILHEVIQRRAFSYLEDAGYTFLESGILAFGIAVFFPLIANYLIFSRFRYFSIAFNSQYQPFSVRGFEKRMRSE